MKIRFTLLLLFIVTTAWSQDTLTLLQYNLLNYGNYTSYCTANNNSHEQKDIYLRAIINYTKPDVFTVNELSQYEFYHDRILTEVLNSSGRNYYRRAELTNLAGSYLLNQLYYDSRKLVLYSQKVIQYNVRDVNLYTLYARNDGLARGDTIFINCIVAHLKAGSGNSNAAVRTTMTRNTMEWLRLNAKPGNFLFMGDFNIYTSDETAYQNLINPLPVNASFRFFDPINMPGAWNNNYDFRYWHTQSVSADGNGCQAGGGMDDRFDFILASASIMNGNQGVKYVTDSYYALGQDGRHYNKSITDAPANTSVPSNVLTALGNNSDHLPVMMKLSLSSSLPNALCDDAWKGQVQLVYVPDNFPVLRIRLNEADHYRLRIIGVTGMILYETSVYLSPGINEYTVPINGFSPGFYLVRLENSHFHGVTLKVVR
jgi:endonuclease/exonuclease/phosphatase family metal-dependent hydrolase